MKKKKQANPWDALGDLMNGIGETIQDVQKAVTPKKGDKDPLGSFLKNVQEIGDDIQDNIEDVNDAV